MIDEWVVLVPLIGGGSSMVATMPKTLPGSQVALPRLTGSTASPSLFEVIWAIGKEEVVARLRRNSSFGAPETEQVKD